VTHLLYPSSPIRTRKADEQYAEEVDAVRDAGFDVSVFSLENFQGGEFAAFPPLPLNGQVLYRGWMLSAEEYRTLAAATMNAGANLLVSAEEYLSSHYLANWYPLIQEFTPETHIFPVDADLETELKRLGWPAFFIKDYVKSLKTSVGSRVSTPEQVSTLIAEMKKFRGTIEGGFCVRRVEDFVATTERRYFVMKGTPHAGTGNVPEVVKECARRLKQRFYSIDVIERADGELRVVEVGDGQVSDLVGWDTKRFAGTLKEHFQD
jgi:hypothetical protein